MAITSVWRAVPALVGIASAVALCVPAYAGATPADTTPPTITGGPVVKAVVGQHLPWLQSRGPFLADARFAVRWRANDPESDVCENRVYETDFQSEIPRTNLDDGWSSAGARSRGFVKLHPLVGGSVSGGITTGVEAVSLNCTGLWSSAWRSAMPTLVDETGHFYGPDGDYAQWATRSTTGDWGVQQQTSLIDGTALTTSLDGASVTYLATSPVPRKAGIVATVGPTAGSIEVSVNGILQRTIDLYATVSRDRVVVGNVRLRGKTADVLTIVARNSGGGAGTSGTAVVLDGLVLI